MLSQSESLSLLGDEITVHGTVKTCERLEPANGYTTKRKRFLLFYFVVIRKFIRFMRVGQVHIFKIFSFAISCILPSSTTGKHAELSSQKYTKKKVSIK